MLLIDANSFYGLSISQKINIADYKITNGVLTEDGSNAEDDFDIGYAADDVLRYHDNIKNKRYFPLCPEN